MDILKKHYEKVLLGLVLLGLVIGAAFLPIMISNERSELESKRQEYVTRPVQPLPPLDLAHETEVLKRAEIPLKLDLSSGSKVFNPYPWVKTPEGRLIKAQEGNIGPKAVVVTEISPLYTIINLSSVQVTDSGPRYMISVERQAASNPSDRRRRSYYASPDAKNEVFMVREVKGPPEDPTELVLELVEGGDRVTVAKDNPFQRVDGYMADLRYEPEKRSWNDVRVGAGGAGTVPIIINGESYIVVAIDKGEVVLSAKSNNKKTPIPYNPASNNQ